MKIRISVALLALAAACSSSSSSHPGLDSGAPPDAGSGPAQDSGTPFITPSPETLKAAQVIQQQIPGAAVAFSQHTGAIIRVDAPGLTGLVEGAQGPGVPLVDARGTDEQGQAASLMEFMSRFGTAFGLQAPATELQIPRDSVNDALLLPQEQFANGDLPHLADLRLRRFVQTLQGVPVPGRDVIGLFDAQGGLQSVTSRLLKVDCNFPVTPAFTPADLWTRFPSSLRDAAVQRNPSLRWLQAYVGPTVGLEHAAELVVEMVTPEGRLDSANPSALPLLAYRLVVRGPGVQGLLVVDAKSGALIEAVDIMPSDWASEGTAGVAGANDETGKNYIFFLNAVFGTNRYMGVIKGNGIPDWVDPGNFAAVSDTSGRANLALTYSSPMTIPTSVNGNDNEWNNDATYVGGKRQAGALISSITTTFDYWNTRRFWRGWDGQGATFWASIYNHKSASSAPELNAWGGNGIIQIGDGTTATGQFLGSSHEVMGHELTHNVISATTKLEYLNESGAVNESLADFFGVAMTANRSADDYASDYIADDVGWNLRNMRDPTLTGQPAEYKDFVKAAASSDSGGVHTNSGILNKAHTLLVKGGTFNGIVVPRVGLERVEQIIWASMRFRSYGEKATLEEFAQGVVSICKVTDGFNQVFGDTSYAATCSAFRKAYQAVGVLPSFAGVLVATATARAGSLAALVENGSGKDVTSVISHSSFVITDTGSGKQYTVPSRAARTDADGGAATDFLAGDRLVLTADLPDELKAVSNARKPLDVMLEVDGVTEQNPSALQLRHAGVVLGADLVAGDFTLTANPNGGFELKASLNNFEGTGFPAGIQGTVLARFGGHAPFDLFGGLTGQGALPSAQAGAGPVLLLDLMTGNGSQYNFANGMPLLEVPTAKPVPGRAGLYEVWFDAQGGLDVLDQHFQVYVLVDSGDQVDELNETNNLLCVNCHAPGQAQGSRGVIVRLPKGTNVAALFPASVAAAAAKLPAAYDRVLPLQQLQTVKLPYKLTLTP